jgi:hypothetical protein
VREATEPGRDERREGVLIVGARRDAGLSWTGVKCMGCSEGTHGWWEGRGGVYAVTCRG